MSDEYRIFKEECVSDIRSQAQDEDCKSATYAWNVAARRHKYCYHFEWMGRPIIQYPPDMIAIQELVWAIKPDLIIETGIAHGGSLVMNASLLALLDLCDAIESGSVIDARESTRKVLGIDIDIRSHNRKAIESHPMASRIQMIQGSSISSDVAELVQEVASKHETVLVCLDSNHTHDHVLRELELYAPLTSCGSYCVVFDTIIQDMPNDMYPDRPWNQRNNPKTAVHEYLRSTDDFQIDHALENKLLITVAPDGYLKRVRGP